MSQSEPSELQPRELLQIAANFCEAQGIAYRVVGSMASIAYGENQFTNDVGVVMDLRQDHIDALCQRFTAPDYYLARHAVEEAVRKRFQFNIIHIPTGLKIDVMLPKQTDYAAVEQQRAVRLTDPDGFSALFASPEDAGQGDRGQAQGDRGQAQGDRGHGTSPGSHVRRASRASMIIGAVSPVLLRQVPYPVHRIHRPLQ